MPTPSTPTTPWWSRLLPPRLRPAAAPPPSVFPPGFLASLERLRLAALRAMGGGVREGHRLGAYKGGQLEFHGHRAYSPGDEIRYIDWNAEARLGKPYIKEFAREEAGMLHLLLDATPSMALGAPAKWDFARRIALLFSHVALASKDGVRLHVFRANGASEPHPRSGVRISTKSCMDFLAGCAVDAPAFDEGAGDAGVFDAGITAFLRTKPKRGGVMLIGDFWLAEEAIARAVSRLTGAGHDVSAIHVLAPEELAVAVDGDLLARGMEGGTVELNGAGGWAARYTAEVERHRAAVEALIRKRGGNYLFATSNTPLEQALIATLRQRRWVS